MEGNVQEYLKRVDINVLKQKIQEFRKLNICDMNYNELSNAILNVLCVDGRFCCYTNTKLLPAGTKLYRAKEWEGTIIPDKRFNKYEDFWETNPKYLSKYGRLNKPHEPLLYVSLEGECAASEVKLKSNKIFSLIRYTTKEEIKVNVIGGEFNYSQMGVYDEKVIMVHNIYNEFLREEFSREVQDGKEDLYRISEIIAKTYYDLPPRDVQDAWGYASVKDKSKYNLCFRPDIAHDKLELDGAMICNKDESGSILVRGVAYCENAEQQIKIMPVGSELQRKVFPEIEC